MKKRNSRYNNRIKRRKRIASICMAALFILGGLSIYAIENRKKEVENISITNDATEQTLLTEKISIETNEIEFDISDEEIELMAILTMAEAEGESELGKRLVIDTILNRKDSQNFPNTIKEVVYYPNAFSSIWNGRFEKCYLKEDILQLVKEELINRTDNNCVFFRTERYSDYGIPMYKEGSHYFSKED